MQANPGPHAGREKTFRRLFEVAIWIKGINGLIETAAGILLLSVSFRALNSFIINLTQDEIQEDSGDLVDKVLRHAANHLTEQSKLIAGLYLLGNGVVKVFLAVCILRGKLWCFPIAMAIVTVFVLLQCIRLSYHFSWMLFLGALIDVAIVVFIWREYKRLGGMQKIK